MALSTPQLRLRAPTPGLSARVATVVPGVVPAWYAREVLAPFVLSRVVLTLVGLWASAGNWAATWAGWDGGWYLSIARDGYSQHASGQSNTAFAPALPLLMRLISGLVGGAGNDTVLLIAGVVAVNTALLVALGYLVALVRLELDEATARRAALCALVFPSTLFLSAVSPHAIFLAGAIAAVCYARRGRWWLAGLLGGLAGLARVQGALIALPWLRIARRARLSAAPHPPRRPGGAAGDKRRSGIRGLSTAGCR